MPIQNRRSTGPLNGHTAAAPTSWRWLVTSCSSRSTSSVLAVPSTVRCTVSILASSLVSSASNRWSKCRVNWPNSWAVCASNSAFICSSVITGSTMRSLAGKINSNASRPMAPIHVIQVVHRRPLTDIDVRKKPRPARSRENRAPTASDDGTPGFGVGSLEDDLIAFIYCSGTSLAPVFLASWVIHCSWR